MNKNRKTLKMPVRYLMNAVLVVLLFLALSYMTGNMLSTYQNKVLMTVGINIILAVSLNVATGYLGQLPLGHAGFMAVGAYTCALFTKYSPLPDGVSFAIGLALGAVMAGLFGVLIGVPALRLTGDYLAILTLGFGEIIRITLNNIDDVLGFKLFYGAKGLKNIPKYSNYWNVFLCVVITCFAIHAMMKSRHGRAVLAIRDNEIAAESCGIQTTYYKVMAFAFSAAFAGLAGGLYACYLGVLDPSTFGFMKSIEILVMVVLGGMGSMLGSILSATVLTILPEADIQHLGKWAGFADAYRCNFLNPNDALFAKIQKLFLDEQKKLFGTDHIYGLDPFNEVDPPSFEPEYLRKIASDMYATLTAADPKAQWMQMTWMFYFDKDKWTSERMKALLTGVPQNKMILLDYHCENVELWKRTEHFHDQPYIWCYLGNFGGNTTLTGNVKESGARLENALINGGGNLKGIGSTLEGLDVMQFPYEYILEKAWNLNVDDNKWIECLADRHVGCVSQPVRDAWKRLFNDIYAQVPRTLGTLPGYRPALNKNSEKRTSNVYSNVELLEVWRKLNEAPSDRRDAFRLDLITVGRQVLGNYFLDVKMEFDRMVEAKDYQALKACGEKMKEILNDLDKLNAFHPYCSLDKWIDDARKMGDSPQLKDYYEKNARNLITTWGGSLNDYASRSWAGLISDYYAKRWEVYIDTFIKAVGEGVEVDQKQLEDELKEIEEGWVNATDRKDVRKDIHSATDGLLSFSTFLFSKYQRLVK